MGLAHRKILLIVGGGIAAYKALELVRLLDKAEAEVQAVLTDAGAQFVTPLSLESLTRHPVRRALFDLDAESRMGHIELSRWADLVVVVPATADLMGKLANGLANDLASTLLLACNRPVLLAPAMNVQMWLHPSVTANAATLRAQGVHMVGPDEGTMACGEFGPGRMAEPNAIFDAITDLLATPGPLSGKHVLITAGPTAEAIDPVRVLTNRSSGKQGFATAAAAARAGARVTLVAGPVALPTPAGVTRVDVESAAQMLAACQAALPADAAICTAAVSDWRVDPAAHKLKKSKDGPPSLRLIETPDILKTLSTGADRPRCVIGFAAETDDLVAHARAKLAAKGCDLIVANSVADGAVFGADDTRWTVLSGDGVEDWGALSKSTAAARLIDVLTERMKD
jgi:phosphopantothenoylcysteine decarboxylase/phosphopantothenate--cysteine ligase